MSLNEKDEVIRKQVQSVEFGYVIVMNLVVVVRCLVEMLLQLTPETTTDFMMTRMFASAL